MDIILRQHRCGGVFAEPGCRPRRQRQNKSVAFGLNNSLKKLAIPRHHLGRRGRISGNAHIRDREIPIFCNLIWIFIRGLNNAACGGGGLPSLLPRQGVIVLHTVHDCPPFGRETGVDAEGLFYKSGEECRWRMRLMYAGRPPVPGAACGRASRYWRRRLRPARLSSWRRKLVWVAKTGRERA